MIKTYFWNTNKISYLNYVKSKIKKNNKFFFKHGNAGDIFAKDLILWLYKTKAKNTEQEVNRIFLVGSIMNKLKIGDLVNGIGWKGNDLKHKAEIIEKAKVYGVRGPLTKSLFEKHNNDLKCLKFEYDPGLLVKEVYNIDLKKSKNNQVIFIPHYSDNYKSYPNNIKTINIDNKPINIVKEILKSSIVYSSSLHGIIFSHALNKPCVYVKPFSNESTFKFDDYFLSVGLGVQEPLNNIHNMSFFNDKPTLPSKMIGVNDFYFPSFNELKFLKISD